MGFFNQAAVKQFGTALAVQLAKELPPASLDKRQKLSVNKVTRLLDRAYQQATDFQRQHRLGFIRRAVLANTFKWELKNRGYPEDFIELATEGLVVAVTKAGPAANTGTTR